MIAINLKKRAIYMKNDSRLNSSDITNTESKNIETFSRLVKPQIVNTINTKEWRQLDMSYYLYNNDTIIFINNQCNLFNRFYINPNNTYSYQQSDFHRIFFHCFVANN